jgi:hypothetical protein
LDAVGQRTDWVGRGLDEDEILPVYEGKVEPAIRKNFEAQKRSARWSADCADM